ncbi:hypothetical protein VTN77DRAFT_3079 [Rasamsonia byssochlamydoides]|uniref:uncharacterized protein n=1 Tax=Rasamsonia byssochlamydoides TaxID=89139 RepID=UPI003742B18C
MAATIIHYIWILSHIHLHEDIQPSSSGFFQMYLTLWIFKRNGIRSWLIPRPLYAFNGIMPADVIRFITGIQNQHSHSRSVASALSKSGVSVFCTSFLDPSLSPIEQKTFHLVPGHIVKDGVLYEQVCDFDSKLDTRTDEDNVTARSSETNLQFIRSIGVSDSPWLLVKETTETGTLQANYAWQYRPIKDDSKEGAPTLLDNASTMVVSAFGMTQLQRDLFNCVYLIYCEKKKAQVSRGNQVFRDTCSEVHVDLSRGIDGSSEVLPRPGEWVLRESIGKSRARATDEVPTKLYRGSFVKLYSLLGNWMYGRSCYLVRSPGCLLCVAQWKAPKVIIVSGQQPPTEIVYAEEIRLIDDGDYSRDGSSTVSHGERKHFAACEPIDSERVDTRQYLICRSV